MAAWEQEVEAYEERRNQPKVDRSNEPPVEIGGVLIPANIVPDFQDVPLDQEHAEAAANIKCGKVYG
ncbi:hypothetical protein CDQ91_00035 [Sphingopyxis witflariensis]|uniref:Uncharacterized protein n=2 Tax=Sphingopyxis witflariensis TaxID=173675 RepID=A0A246K4H4_9SPHN|nr:hypothetical protein CDQ91_00035 [Sphingopyxis witflariensis]